MDSSKRNSLSLDLKRPNPNFERTGFGCGSDEDSSDRSSKVCKTTHSASLAAPMKKCDSFNVVSVGERSCDNLISITSRSFSASTLSQYEALNKELATAQDPRLYLESITSYRPVKEEIDAMKLKKFEWERGYTKQVVHAVQSCDLKALRLMFNSGVNSMNCCNRFGESILHMACRRGYRDIVKFLIQEAKVCANIMDDYGRTPMHDAFWTPEPSFEIVELLIERCPQLLFIEDKRGFVPLAYTRRIHWIEWNTFFKKIKPCLLRRFASLEA